MFKRNFTFELLKIDKEKYQSKILSITLIFLFHLSSISPFNPPIPILQFFLLLISHHSNAILPKSIHTLTIPKSHNHLNQRNFPKIIANKFYKMSIVVIKTDAENHVSTNEEKRKAKLLRFYSKYIPPHLMRFSQLC